MNEILLLVYKIAYTILTVIGVRDNLTDWRSFSRSHPLALLISCVFACFAPQILASIIFSESVLPSLQNIDILLALGVSSAILYFPGDIFYKLFEPKILKFTLAGIKESYRAYKVYAGVTHAEHMVHGGAACAVLLAGVCKGAGTELLRPIEQSLRGEWDPQTFEFINPSYYLKISLIASLVFYVNSSTNVLIGMSGIMAATKLGVLFMEERQAAGGHANGHPHHHWNPFESIENIICSLLFGKEQFAPNQEHGEIMKKD